MRATTQSPLAPLTHSPRRSKRSRTLLTHPAGPCPRNPQTRTQTQPPPLSFEPIHLSLPTREKATTNDLTSTCSHQDQARPDPTSDQAGYIPHCQVLPSYTLPCLLSLESCHLSTSYDATRPLVEEAVCQLESSICSSPRPSPSIPAVSNNSSSNLPSFIPPLLLWLHYTTLTSLTTSIPGPLPPCPAL